MAKENHRKGFVGLRLAFEWHPRRLFAVLFSNQHVLARSIRRG